MCSEDQLIYRSHLELEQLQLSSSYDAGLFAVRLCGHYFNHHHTQYVMGTHDHILNPRALIVFQTVSGENKGIEHGYTQMSSSIN